MSPCCGLARRWCLWLTLLLEGYGYPWQNQEGPLDQAGVPLDLLDPPRQSQIKGGPVADWGGPLGEHPPAFCSR